MISNFENFIFKNGKNTKSENTWSDNTSLEAHLIPILFCIWVIGFQVSVRYVFVLSFSLFRICLVFELWTQMKNIHTVYAYIDFILMWHRFRHKDIKDSMTGAAHWTGDAFPTWPNFCFKWFVVPCFYYFSLKIK